MGPGLESIAKQTREFLGNLCDLQILTGLAITIAGWTQHATISYYHQQLVLAYWSLALNSFWAARVQYLDVDSKNDDGTETRDTIRCIAVLCNYLVAMTFSIHVEIREQQAWDDDGGPCYSFLDGTSSLTSRRGKEFSSKLVQRGSFIPRLQDMYTMYTKQEMETGNVAG
ncbi:hypothetical protein MCOR29_004901 [Pyricularia oryzae]|nr:hypothetical protein MCOR29_004901 [Pyricularia oryzae]KAI6611455.1 hypothetical protein MCOR14_011849 [Pyricularia oryzae]KAI6639078.1 hypothetical protein MCOR08_002320 [Pyricularia oryzae]